MGLKCPSLAGRAVPGQFVMIRVRPGIDPLLRRPFSVFGVEKDIFHLYYRVVGKGTEFMADAVKGETLSVLGPLGRGFVLPKPDEASLLVGGGMGITPLFFLARLIRKGEMMMGFATADEIVREDIQGELPLEISLATDDGTEGHKGVVTELLEERLDRTRADKGSLRVYACGPTPMLKRVAALASRYGTPCQVSLEASMACGLGACQGCAVPAAPEQKRAYFHVCKDGPVFLAEGLNWSGL